MAYLWYFIYSECFKLRKQKTQKEPPKNSLMSFENTLLLNMMDYEQIKFCAKMVAES